MRESLVARCGIAGSECALVPAKPEADATVPCAATVGHSITAPYLFTGMPCTGAAAGTGVLAETAGRPTAPTVPPRLCDRLLRDARSAAIVAATAAAAAEAAAEANTNSATRASVGRRGARGRLKVKHRQGRTRAAPHSDLD